MRRLSNAALVAVLVSSATVLTTPSPSAAAGTSHESAAEDCSTTSDATEGAQGAITVCVVDGAARVSGHLVDTLPGSGWVAPDGYCAAWWIDWATASGDSASYEVVVCGHFGSDEVSFDYDPSGGDDGVKGITGLNRVDLGLVSV